MGLDHRHIYDQVQSLLDVGGTCVGYWTDGKGDDRIFGGWRAVDRKWFSSNGLMVKIEQAVGGPTS